MPGTPSVVELLERLAQRDELIEALSAELGRARVRIAELEARLGLNSKNSSKPPRSDGVAKPAPKSLRRRGAREAGGPDGHLGSTSAPVAVPDEVIAHEPGCCRGCGHDLSGRRRWAGSTEDRWCWATQAADALRELNQLVKDVSAANDDLDGIDPPRSPPVHRYRSAALLGVDATRARSSDLMGEHNALAHRLINRQDDYPRFTVDPGSPFDDNAAEREIRTRDPDDQTAAEGLRMLWTVTGAEQFCAIRSCLAIAAEHGIHFFAPLTTLAQGRPGLPESA